MNDINFVNSYDNNRVINDYFLKDSITKVVDECNELLLKQGVKLDMLSIAPQRIVNNVRKHVMLKTNHLVTIETYLKMVNFLIEKKYNLVEIHNELGGN